MTFWTDQAVRALTRNRSFSLFFMLNLAMGLAGFIAIHSLSTSLNRHLNTNLKEILTADLVVSAARPLTREELTLIDDVLGPGVQTARQILFYTMVRGRTGARLTQVNAVDQAFPLYGAMVFEPPEGTRPLPESPGISMTRDTARTFGITPGDTVSLGSTSFAFTRILKEDPDRSLTSFELAPKIYMAISQVQGTGLIRFGSRVRHVHFYRLPATSDISAVKKALNARFDTLFQGHPVISVFDTHDMSRGLGRITRLFTGYLGLVSSVALFLAGIATAYLFRGYLDRRKQEIAILMSIGAGQRQILFLYTAQVLILGGAASLAAIVFSQALLPAFPVVLKDMIPKNLAITTPVSTVIIALVMGMAGSLIFCLPVFHRLFAIKPLMLLQGIHGRNRETSGQRLFRYLSLLPGAACFLGLAVLLADSLEKGLTFTLGFMGVMACLSGIGLGLFKSCRLLSRSGSTVRKIAFRNLYRNTASSLACFVTIAMGTFLISLIPQLQKGLQDELARPDGLKIPVFFLVDIQEEQRDALVEFIRSHDAVLSNLSPMVRGRILSVNNENFYDRQQKAAETSSGRQFRRLEFNFSFRKNLDDSEAITHGRKLSDTPWQFGSDTLFELSVAEEFADWYSIAMDDVITFDIQGIPFTGRVVNLRKVRWNSFQPNFFLLFQDGVLNDAPKTFLASIAGVPREKRADFKNAITDTFSNISVIDVTQTIGTLLAISDRLSISIKFMAFLAIAAGLVSIFSIARHEARNSQQQILLLKVLGAEFNDIRAISLVEFGFIGFSASAVAMCLSLLASWIISWFFFDRLWTVHWTYSLLIPVMTTLTCTATSWFASRKTLMAAPALLLADSR